MDRLLDSLPRGDFTPLEVALRQNLLDWCSSLRGPFPLAEWIEHRVGGELVCVPDEHGNFAVALRDDKGNQGTMGKGTKGGRSSLAPSLGLSPQPGNKGGKVNPNDIPLGGGKGKANDTPLPQQKGSKGGKDALVGKVKAWQRQSQSHKEAWYRYVEEITGATNFDPNRYDEAMLSQFLQMANTGKIELKGSLATQTPQPLGFQKDHHAFLASLPMNSFLPGEMSLRDAIVTFLARWTRSELATLPDLTNSAEIRREMSQLLPQGVSLKDWVDHRIGGEIELKPDGRGKITVFATPLVMKEIENKLQDRRELGSRPEKLRKLNDGSNKMMHGGPFDARTEAKLDEWVQAKRARDFKTSDRIQKELEAQGIDSKLARPDPRKAGGSSGEPLAPSYGLHGGGDRLDSGGPAAPKDVGMKGFFDTLPAEFTEAELDLREALLQYIDKGPGQFHFYDGMLGDKNINLARQQLLPRSVKPREWIEKRMGGEVELRQHPGGVIQVCLASEPPMEPPARGKEGPSKAAHVFESDAFTPEELELREATLEYIERNAGTFINANILIGDPTVSAARIKAFPQKVKMLDWIVQRIGGEVDIRRHADGSTQVCFPGDPPMENPGKKDGRGNQVSLPGPNLAKWSKDEKVYFKDLPPGHTEAERALLEAVLAILADGPQTTEFVQQDRRVESALFRVVPGEARVSRWAKHRASKEIQVVRDDGVENMLIKGSEADDSKEGKKERRQAMKVAFFESLPPDLNEEEAALRDALLRVLDEWAAVEGDKPMKLVEASDKEEVRELRDTLLKPHNCGAKEWIDRRISSDIETGFDEKQTVIARTGQLGSQYAPVPDFNANKRKLDESEHWH